MGDSVWEWGQQEGGGEGSDVGYDLLLCNAHRRGAPKGIQHLQ